VTQVLTTSRPLVARAGNHLIELTRPNPNLPVWRVEVSRAGAVATPVGELTRSYPVEQLARTIARVLTVALRVPGATVKTARSAVVRHIDAEINWLLTQPGIAGRAEKADVLLGVRAGFAADDRQVAS
jgi:hypothetical protein